MNGTRAVSPLLASARTWIEMIGYWAGRAAPAVVAGSTTWSGAELLARAAGAGRELLDLSNRFDAIPALLTSTPAAFAYILGGASVGRPLAPLGPRLTAYELGPVIDTLRADVILTEPGSEPLARALAAERHLRVKVINEPAATSEPLNLDVDPVAAAFVLHTSGTTGQPKPVPYYQGRLAARARVNVELCSLGIGSIYATASPFHHIAGFGNYAVALAAGAAIAPVARFGVEAWAALADLGVTHALTVPTVLEILLDAGVLALPTLKTLQYGGASINPELLGRTLRELPGVDLVNIYGQTEGSPITCLSSGDHRLIHFDKRTELLSSAGRAAPGVEVRIENPDSAGIGEVVARAEHFFAPDADGWLRSGDLGSLENGYLYLRGRRGDKIVHGGENVYPVEVEHVLETHLSVAEAAVYGVPDDRWGEVVKGVLVTADGAGPIDFEELRTYTRERLAGFKVPTIWEVVDSLPRNANGKLLRRILVKNNQPNSSSDDDGISQAR